ncbi:ArsR/SmtB family transcription factor [Agrobacterium sp. rho-8.1]
MLGSHVKQYTFDVDKAAKLLTIISSPVRIEIFRRILVAEWDVNGLCEDIGLSQSAMSQHLAKLREMNLVVTRRHGQQIFYSSASSPIRQVLSDVDVIESATDETEN